MLDNASPIHVVSSKALWLVILKTRKSRGFAVARSLGNATFFLPKSLAVNKFTTDLILMNLCLYLCLEKMNFALIISRCQFTKNTLFRLLDQVRP